MPNLKELLRREHTLRERLEKLIKNGRNTEIEKRTQGFFEIKIDELKQLWIDYSSVDQSINELLLKNPPATPHKYTTDDPFSKMETEYCSYLSELYDGLRQCTPSSDNLLDSSNLVPPPAVNYEESVLPKVSLPKFNGDYDNWRSFHDLFVSLVHRNPRLRPVQKLYHLKNCLQGEAERVLRHTPITNDDYVPAWNKLKERYENKRILANYQLKLLTNQPKLTTETAVGLKTLIDTTEECLQQLQGLQIDTSMWDTLLIHLLIQKLPFMTLKHWEEELGASQDLPTFNQFKSFLTTRLKVLESIADVLVAKPIQPKRATSQSNTKVYHALRGGKCPACNGAHFLPKCPAYQKMDIKARRKLIAANGRCFNCLSKEHSVRDCSSKFHCAKCTEKHHTTLHEDYRSMSISSTPKVSTGETKGRTEQSHFNPNNNFTDLPRSQPVNSNDKPSPTQTFVTRERSLALLSTALVRVKDVQGNFQLLRCLLDTGSESSFITQSACNKLGAQCIPTSVRVTGLNKCITSTSSKQTRLKLSPREPKSTTIEETFLVIPKITDALPSTPISKIECQHLEGLELADPYFWKPRQIDMLLGAGVYAKIVKEGIKRGADTSLTAINTIFGWILMGSTSQNSSPHTSSLVNQTNEQSLDDLLKRFWQIEELPSKQFLSPEDQQCEDYFKANHVRLSNGRYQVKLPFKTTPILGDSRAQALKRFQNLQRRFSLNPELKRDYTQCLNEYLELGHMIEASPPKQGEPYYYIPHHAVFKDSSTTKLRVVFDASARTTSGVSLNDYLLKGPTIQPKLFETLLNWRKYKIAMHADIEKMYRMIEVHPMHQTYQRIVWQNPKTQAVQDYQLTRVTFGTSSAPYLAIRTLRQLAEDEKANWPLASQAVCNNFYVDDLLTGSDNIKDAKELQTQLIEMLNSGGFNLRKWSSNEPDLLNDLPIEHVESKGTLTLSESESIKTLGIQWHPVSDCFKIIVPQIQQPKSLSKRTILSEIASLYDPLGWLSPSIVLAKILMQTLWVTGCSWDHPVPELIASQWNTYKKELQALHKLSIPRWVCYSKNINVQLHGFCDASAKAYAAAIYLRVENSNEQVVSNLLFAKTKVAPIKPITIPRLELNGALLLAKLITIIKESMHLENIPIILWTDSTIVLQWLRDHPSRWKIYIANRVAQIQEIANFNHWRHVPTEENPADLASRGVLASKLINNSLWWHGPAWLIKHESEWPCNQIDEKPTDLEAKPISITSFLSNFEDNILLKYSSFTRLIRIIATIRRFLYNLRHHDCKKLMHLTCSELAEAETVVWRLVQQSAFPNEQHNLKRSLPIQTNSKLLTLNPFMDDNGLIRVGGRIRNASIPFKQKHPIILPRDHHVTQILIDKLHLETLHGGPSLVLAFSRNQFWILDARRCITSRLRKCLTCLRHRNAIAKQQMGELPSFRVNISKPFTKVGVDYAGPLTIKTSKIRNAKVMKGYLCVFVCMVTKAIHIELVSDLTSEAFVAALKRFISRRGLCTDLYSDCGTNFVGGKSILDKELRQAILNSSSDVGQYLSTKAIKWHFNPPSAPHFGGIWEAGVKSIKHHLKRVIGNAVCTFEEYTTILTQIEACLNSRPLCYVSNNTDDPLILTPGHFLIGQPLNTLPEPEDSHPVTLSQRWKYIQQLTKQFWNRWSKDYLNQLQTRSKWNLKQPNIQQNDVVLLKNEHSPPAQWPLGIVEKVFPGTDGLVRVVQVRTNTNTVLRPIVKLCRLPIEHQLK